MVTPRRDMGIGRSSPFSLTRESALLDRDSSAPVRHDGGLDRDSSALDRHAGR